MIYGPETADRYRWISNVTLCLLLQVIHWFNQGCFHPITPKARLERIQIICFIQEILELSSGHLRTPVLNNGVCNTGQ